MPLPDNPNLGPHQRELDAQEVWILVEQENRYDQQGQFDGYYSYKIIGAFATRDGARTERQALERGRKKDQVDRFSTSYQIETRTVRTNSPECEAQLQREKQQQELKMKITKLQSDLMTEQAKLKRLENDDD